MTYHQPVVANLLNCFRSVVFSPELAFIVQWLVSFQSGIVAVPHILFGSTPLKVCGGVIQLVAVAVVHLWLTLWVRRECLRDQAMHHFSAHPAPLHCDLAVACIAHKLAKDVASFDYPNPAQVADFVGACAFNFFPVFHTQRYEKEVKGMHFEGN